MIPVLVLALQIPSPDLHTAVGFPHLHVSEQGSRTAGARAEQTLANEGRPWLFEWGLRGPGLVRFNRVEGLSVGARYGTRSGATFFGATARLGYGDETPNARVDLVREFRRITVTGSAYSELSAVDPSWNALGFENSVRGFLLGRDDGEYFRASGVAVTAGPRRSDARPWTVTLHGEAQRAVFRQITQSVGDWLGGSSLRAVIRASAAEQLGATVRVSPWWGTDPHRAQAGLDLLVRGEVGSHPLLQASATAAGILQLPASFRVATRLRGAVLRGDRIPQRQWYLGGARTLRGFPGSVISGSDLLLARVDVVRRFGFGSLGVFGDGGWAGEGSPSLDGALFSTGAGLSILDGVVRLDVARAIRVPTGWSFQFYLDAVL